MWSVTRRAMRRNDQTFLQQSLTMDAFGEIREDVILVDRTLSCYGRSFGMALAAQEWNLERRGWGELVLRR